MLGVQMHPAPARLDRADPEAQRLDCARRSACLAVAARLEWPGMSCAGCVAYLAMSPAEHRRDMEGMADLVAAIVDLGWWEPGEDR